MRLIRIERMRASRQLKETFYSYKLGDEGSPLRFECLNWDGEDNDKDESLISHVGVGMESVERAWVAMCTGKAAVKRVVSKVELVQNKVSVKTPAGEPTVTDLQEGQHLSGKAEAESPPTEESVPQGRNNYKGYNSDSGTETDLEESPVFSCYVGAERLSGICNDTRGPLPYISVRVAAISLHGGEYTGCRNRTC